MAGWTCPDGIINYWDGILQANSFRGDGSKLSGISTTETDPVFTAASVAIYQEIDAASGAYAASAAEILAQSQASDAEIMEDLDIASGAIVVNTADIATNVTAIGLNTTHRGLTNNPHTVTLAQVGGTTDHTALSNIGTLTHAELETDIGANTASCAELLIETDGASAATLVALTHVAGDGSDHADVATNTTHSTGDGSDHTDVATNTTHSSGDGSDHADVVMNTASCAELLVEVTAASEAWLSHDASLAEIWPDLSGQSEAILANIASCAEVWPDLAGTSAAAIAHYADSSDPHGATLTQGRLEITSDTSSGAACNVYVGTSATPPTANTTTLHSLYVQYTA